MVGSYQHHNYEYTDKEALQYRSLTVDSTSQDIQNCLCLYSIVDVTLGLLADLGAF